MGRYNTMALTRFDEYMNAKGSIPKPKVKAVAGDVEGSTKQYAAAPDAENNLTTDNEGGKVSGKGKKTGGKYKAKNKMSENWGKENPELAFKWFKTVGEQPDGNPSWKYQLGYCYQEGYGVKENPEDAFKWFLQSAEDGFYLAMEVVSECYREGIGVDKNLEEAEKWTLKQTH